MVPLVHPEPVHADGSLRARRPSLPAQAPAPPPAAPPPPRAIQLRGEPADPSVAQATRRLHQALDTLEGLRARAPGRPAGGLHLRSCENLTHQLLEALCKLGPQSSLAPHERPGQLMLEAITTSQALANQVRDLAQAAGTPLAASSPSPSPSPGIAAARVARHWTPKAAPPAWQSALAEQIQARSGQLQQAWAALKARRLDWDRSLDAEDIGQKARDLHEKLRQARLLTESARGAEKAGEADRCSEQRQRATALLQEVADGLPPLERRIRAKGALNGLVQSLGREAGEVRERATEKAREFFGGLATDMAARRGQTHFLALDAETAKVIHARGLGGFSHYHARLVDEIARQAGVPADQALAEIERHFLRNVADGRFGCWSLRAIAHWNGEHRELQRFFRATLTESIGQAAQSLGLQTPLREVHEQLSWSLHRHFTRLYARPSPEAPQPPAEMGQTMEKALSALDHSDKGADFPERYNLLSCMVEQALAEYHRAVLRAELARQVAARLAPLLDAPAASLDPAWAACQVQAQRFAERMGGEPRQVFADWAEAQLKNDELVPGQEMDLQSTVLPATLRERLTPDLLARQLQRSLARLEALAAPQAAAPQDARPAAAPRVTPPAAPPSA